MDAARSAIVSLGLVLSIASLAAAGQAQEPANQSQAPRPSATTTTRSASWFIAVNGGYQVDDHTFSETREQEVNREQMTWTTDYAIERGGQYEGAVGGYAANGFGGAVTYSFYQDNNSAAAVSARVPHPFFFNQPRQFEGQSVALQHREQVIHVSAAYMAPIGSNLEVSVAGGPSFFIVDRSFVDNVIYDETYPYDSATFDRTTIRDVSENRTGFHVGGDVSWFFSNNVGIGGMVRYTRATVEFPAAGGGGEAISVDLGGVQAGFGLRVRFGGKKTVAAAPPVQQEQPEPDPTRIYASPDTAGPATDETYVVTLVATPIYVRPDATREPLRIFEPNTRLKVMRQMGPWIRVEFQHPRYGRSEGFVEAKNVRLVKPGAS